ncbi:hypothetical protein P3L10_030220 [Capsicum annuum]
MEKYKSLKILQKSPNSGVCFLYLNRPSHLNAVSRDFLTEFPKAISSLGQNPDVAVIIFAGSGIDFQTLDNALKGSYAADCGRNVERLRLHMKFLQEAITALECCRKPVIAAVHGACIGGAIDIITACDIRFCSSDAFFSVKEVDLAITADLGTLQRLPVLLGLKMPWSWLLLVGGLQVPKLKTWAWSLRFLLLNKLWRKASNLLLRVFGGGFLAIKRETNPSAKLEPNARDRQCGASPCKEPSCGKTNTKTRKDALYSFFSFVQLFVL